MTHVAGVSGAAQRAESSKSFEWMARVGYAVSGVLHVLIGWIAIRIATGGGGDADASGALNEVAKAPAGEVLLWIGAAGFAALGLWQLIEALAGSRSVEPSKRTGARLKAAGKAAVYLALAWTTFSYARGARSSSSEQSSDFTASLMDSGWGKALLVAIGVGVIAVGIYHVYKGFSQKFTDDLRGPGGGPVGRAVVVLGVVGYVAKGVALAVVGVLFIVAVAESDPDEATGLDGALKTLGEQPFGPALIIGVAVGFIAYGVYSFARSRYAKM